MRAGRDLSTPMDGAPHFSPLAEATGRHFTTWENQKPNHDLRRGLPPNAEGVTEGQAVHELGGATPVRTEVILRATARSGAFCAPS